MPQQATAATELIHALERHGTELIIGLPGEENLDVVEAIRTSSIEMLVVRHEQHAAFMAATIGRLTREPGVCLATLGPGAINLFTGLAHAFLGGFPLIAITGQKPLVDNDEGSFQVVDVVASAKPLVKWATKIADPADISSTIDRAFRIATSGRPGPVLIEIPEDVAAGSVSAPSQDRKQTQIVAPTPIAHPAAIEAAVAAIAGASWPVVLASEAANNVEVAEALRSFAERTGVGVLTTQLGKGAIAASHPLSLGALGMHRRDYAHHALTDADVVIAIGYSPVEHPPLRWNRGIEKTIIHVAPWSAEPERGYQPSIDVVGDLAASLGSIAAGLEPRCSDHFEKVKRFGLTTTSLLALEPDAEPGAIPSPLDVTRVVRSALGPDDIVTLDNGAYKLWFSRHYRCAEPQTLLLDNALATMGAGLAAGMAAAIVRPDATVVAVCGDGGFVMNMQDLETAVRAQLDLIVVVVRDDAFGFIGWHQDEQDLPRFAVDVTNPSIVALAVAFGAQTRRVDSAESLRDALSLARKSRGVWVIDCPMSYDINELLDDDLYDRSAGEFADTA